MKKVSFNYGNVAAETAVGAATLAGIGAGVAGINSLYGAASDAITKKRDFNRMLDFSPEVRYAHKTNPKLVNAAFDTLRHNDMDFSKDPLVASTFVSHMVDMQGQGAFETALQMKSKSRPQQGAVQTVMETTLKGLPQVYTAHAKRDTSDVYDTAYQTQKAKSKALRKFEKDRFTGGRSSVPMASSSGSVRKKRQFQQVKFR